MSITSKCLVDIRNLYDSIISYQDALQLLHSYHCDHIDIWDCVHSELLRNMS